MVFFYLNFNRLLCNHSVVSDLGLYCLPMISKTKFVEKIYLILGPVWVEKKHNKHKTIIV